MTRDGVAIPPLEHVSSCMLTTVRLQIRSVDDVAGAQRNMTFYAALMNATGKAYFIENCHWGHCDDSDDSSCPTLDWCPFNWYKEFASPSHPLCFVSHFKFEDTCGVLRLYLYNIYIYVDVHSVDDVTVRSSGTGLLATSTTRHFRGSVISKPPFDSKILSTH